MTYYECFDSHSLHFNGILSKGPYPPCLRMADRAPLAGYPRLIDYHLEAELKEDVWIDLQMGNHKIPGKWNPVSVASELIWFANDCGRINGCMSCTWIYVSGDDVSVAGKCHMFITQEIFSPVNSPVWWLYQWCIDWYNMIQNICARCESLLADFPKWKCIYTMMSSNTLLTNLDTTGYISS